MASNSHLNPLPRIVVPFAFIEPNTDNPGLKDFTPAIVPADTPDPDDEVAAKRNASRGAASPEGAGDVADPKAPSSVRESAASSPIPNVPDVPSAREEPPADAERASSAKVTKETAPKE